jgi:hypothetical protein
MGLINISQFQYYNNEANYGNYQFVTLENIISAFKVAYVGEGKIINKVSSVDVQFHAMRAIQELSYDVFRSFKSQEIEVPNTLKMALPQDYVNYVKLTMLGENGIEKILYPTSKTSNPFAIQQDENGNYVFFDPTPNQDDPTQNGPVDLMEQGTDDDPDMPDYTYVVEQPGGDPTVITNVNVNDSFSSDTVDSFNATPVISSSNSLENDDDIDLYNDTRGRRYGLDPASAQNNGSFYIDYLRGFIHFGSSLAGKTITLKYVSDGLGTDSEMVVHKFCEEAVYKWIAYGIISSKANMPEAIVQRYKKERFAETRKAKIRLSNIKIEEFTQVLKGMSKQIK